MNYLLENLGLGGGKFKREFNLMRFLNEFKYFQKKQFIRIV
jgi:hypothetical protein